MNSPYIIEQIAVKDFDISKFVHLAIVRKYILWFESECIFQLN
jgi:hypothetical protein